MRPQESRERRRAGRLALTEALAQPLTLHQLADGKVIAANTKFGHVCVILARLTPVGEAS